MQTIRLAASIPALLALATANVAAVSFPDYLPESPAQYGVRTFTQTHGGVGGFVSQIVGSASVPYASGARSGVILSVFSADSESLIFSNDGNEVRFLGNNEGGSENYVSSDLCLTSHPNSFAFGQILDGQIIDQRPYYIVSSDLSSSFRENSQLILLDIQNVTVPNGTYQDAIILWTLDADFSYSALLFDGMEASLGITLPDASQTNNLAVTAIDVFGVGGLIATGDVDAATGALNALFELQGITAVAVEAGPELGYILELGGPNPFHLQATIYFHVPREGRVKLEIYDAGGRLVRTLVDQVFSPGQHTRVWDGQDTAGHAVPTGSYFVRMKAGEVVASRKIVRLQ